MIKKQELFFMRDRNKKAKILKAKRLEEIKTIGLKLQSEGLSSRKIHNQVKLKGYKIGYHSLFYLLKNNNLILALIYLFKFKQGYNL